MGRQFCRAYRHSVRVQFYRRQLYLRRKQSVFLRLHNAKAIWLLRLATLGMVIAGTLISFPLIWQLADMIMACMAITNLTAILLLSPVVYTLASDYLRQRKLGVRPQFDPRRFPDIEPQLAPDTGGGIARLSRQSQPSVNSAAFLLKSQKIPCKD